MLGGATGNPALLGWKAEGNQPQGGAGLLAAATGRGGWAMPAEAGGVRPPAHAGPGAGSKEAVARESLWAGAQGGGLNLRGGTGSVADAGRLQQVMLHGGGQSVKEVALLPRQAMSFVTR